MAVDLGAIPHDLDTYESDHVRSNSEDVQSPFTPFSTSSPADGKQPHGRVLEMSEKRSMDSWTSSMDDHAEVNGMLESQKTESDLMPESSTPTEYLVPLSKKLTYLGLYFCLNVALTLSNKQLLLKVR